MAIKIPLYNCHFIFFRRVLFCIIVLHALLDFTSIQVACALCR